MKQCVTVLALLVFFDVLFAQSDPPELSSWIRNLNDTTGYTGILANVLSVKYTSTNVYVNSTGIPVYPIGPWPGDPNIPSNQNFVFRIPRSPQQNTGTKTNVGLGSIGMWVNGVPIFNSLDAMSYHNQNIWHQNAVVVEASSFDAALGHPAPGGVYHHHQNPKSLYNTADTVNHSSILGYAYDGFPVYGPYGYANTNGTGGIKRIQSSYRTRSITQRHTLPNGTVLSAPQYGPDVSGTYPLGYYAEDFEYVSGLGDLDQYNGRFAVTPEYPGGTYAYYVTINSNGSSAYPYTLGLQYYGIVATDNIPNPHVTVPPEAVTYEPPTSLAAPILVGVSGNPLSPTLKWHSVEDAAFYRLQVSSDSLFGSTVFDDSTLTDTAATIDPIPDSMTYYWRVRAKYASILSGWSEVASFTVNTGTNVYNISVNNRWNLLSLPVVVADFQKSALFPTSTSPAYQYSGSYMQKDTLDTGTGYWLKFGMDEIVNISGWPITTDTVDVAAGWNLVGSVADPVAVNQISSNPPAMITSQVFGYTYGYENADTIQPFKAYWVKTNQAGQLILSSSLNYEPLKRIRVVRTTELPPSPPDESNIEHQISNIPKECSLEQNYPNPFNPSTVIRYQLAVDSYVALKIYNTLGQEVGTLVKGARDAGQYVETLHVTSLPSGVYFYRLEAVDVNNPSRSFVERKKMVLLK